MDESWSINYDSVHGLGIVEAHFWYISDLIIK